MANPLASDLDHILSNTGGLWEELRDRNLFITGGTGFFGCWLLESIAWANDSLRLNASLTVLTRNIEAFRRKVPHLAAHPAIRFHTGDVRNFDFPAGEFSHIIHAATESGAALNAQDPLLMFDTIVQGTRRTLDFAAHCGAKKFLLTSSGAVYGKQPPELTHISEEYQGAPDPCDQQSAYGEGKRAAELLCILYSGKFGFEVKIARCFAFVGPYLPLDRHFAIGNFIRDRLNGGPIHVKGDGTPYRSYLYAADLAIWLWTILFKGETCRPYNVGSEDYLTIEELAHLVAENLDKNIEISVAKKKSRKPFAERYIPDINRAKKELCLNINITLHEAVRKTLRYLEKMNSPFLNEMNMDALFRNCPICGGSKVDMLHTQRFVMPENHPLADGYNIVSCDNCGFVYADTASNQNAYDIFYSRNSKYEDEITGTGGGQSWWDLEHIRSIASRISNFLADRKEVRVLDVGCANGGLLGCLKDFGFRNLWGIDPSSSCAEHTRKTGVHAYCSSIFGLPEDIGHFDFVILSHVLEHLYDLNSAIHIVRGLIKHGGHIYLEVPDANRYQQFIYAPFQEFNTEHINHFTLHSLHNLMTSYGFHEKESGQDSILCAPDKKYPVAFAFFQHIDIVDKIVKDCDTVNRLQSYITGSRVLLERIDSRLKELSGKEVIVWGTGQLTMKLLVETSLANKKIVAFVDNNPVNWDKKINKVPILSPLVFKNKNLHNPIVIATTLHQESIINQIYEMGLKNDVITLA